MNEMAVETGLKSKFCANGLFKQSLILAKGGSLSITPND